MIPAALPPPRADAPAAAPPARDDHGFDDTLRRMTGDAGSAAGRAAAEGRPRAAEDRAEGVEERAGAAPDDPDRPRPPADEEPATDPSDTTDDATAVAVPVQAIAPSPAGTDPRHGTGPSAGAEPTTSGAAPAVVTDEVDGDLAGAPPAAGDDVAPSSTSEADLAPAVDGADGADPAKPGADLPDVADVEDPAAEPAHRGARSTTGEGERSGGRRPGAATTAGTTFDPPAAAASPAGEDRGPTSSSPAIEPTARVDVAAAPASPAPATAEVAAPAPAGPTPPVARQLVDHVAPLVEGPDGTHELTIELRPATLGRVQLEVTLEDGVLHVRVHADDPASRRLLGQSLGDLRSALADAGISTGNLDVGDPGSGGSRTAGRDAADRTGPGASDRSTAGGVADAATRTRPLPDGRTALDVLL